MASVTRLMRHAATQRGQDSSINEGSRTIGRLAAASLAVWLVSLGMIAYSLVLSWPGGMVYTDFVSYWAAASLLSQGSGPMLYDMETQRAFQEGLRNQFGGGGPTTNGAFECNPFPNLPPLALPYLALVWLPMPLAYLAWWVIGLGVFALAITRPLRGRENARGIALIMLSFGAVTSTLREGQAYGFLLVAFSLGLMAFVSDRPFLGGLLWGVLVVKPQYVILFGLVFLLKGRWRELSGMAAGGLSVVAISWAMVGPEGMAGFVGMLRDVGSFSATSVDPQSMVNWRAVLLHLVPGLSDFAGSMLVLALGAGTALLAVASCSGPWRPSSARFLLQVEALLLASIVASPHSHIHGMVFLLAPLTLLSGQLSELGAPAALGRGLLVVGYVMAGAFWLFAAWRWLMAPYLLLSLLVVIWMARTAPQAQAGGASPLHVTLTRGTACQ